MPTIHLVIPCFNEQRTLEECVRRICAVDWDSGWNSRLIIIDDHSGDDSVTIARGLAEEFGNIELIQQERNRGKGMAVRVGMLRGVTIGNDEDLIVIHDADLEYDPQDLVGMMHRFLEDDALGAVIGDRFDSGRRTSPLGGMHRFVNRALTRLSNLFTGLGLQDMECCYKMFRRDPLMRMLPDLSEDRFGIEPQIAAALARHRIATANQVVRYDPRTIQQGKKIGLRDGLRALLVIVRERFRKRPNHA